VKRWAVPVAALVVGLAGLAGFVSARRALEAQRAEQAALREELEGWKRRAGEALRELEALRGALGAEAPDEPKGPAGKTAGGDDAGVRRELLKMLTEKEEKLAAAAKEMDSLRLRVDQLEQQLRVAAEEAEKLTAAEREWREQADASRRLAEVLQAELKGKSALAAQMETQNAQLRKREEEARERAARLGRLVEQAEDLQRRREMYLTNILRRYREVTDLYRTLNQQFSNPRDGASPANNDLSRVQNAIYQAEDDMRQLQGLNTQSARLQKEMAEARK
jgi:septation ring formation regulator EzrA